MLTTAVASNTTSPSAPLPGFAGWIRSSILLQDKTVLHDMRDPRTGCRVLFHENKEAIGAFSIDFSVIPDAADGTPHVLEHMLFRGSKGLLFANSGGLQAKEPLSVFSRWSVALESNAITEPDGIAIYTCSPLQSDLYSNFLLSLDAAFFPSLPETGFREEAWRLEPVERLKRGRLIEIVEQSDRIEPAERTRIVEALKKLRQPCVAEVIEKSDLLSASDKATLIEIIQKHKQLRLNGIVLNEELDYYADPEIVLGQGLMQALFPETYFAFDASGDPFEIPTLTPEKLKSFASKYLHPSNCTIAIAGDIDPTSFGEAINSYLRMFPHKVYPDFSIPLKDKREEVTHVEVSVSALGARGVMQAVSFAACPTADPERLEQQRFIAELLGNDSYPFLLEVADAMGIRDGIFSSEVAPEIPVPLLTVGGERGTQMDPDEFKRRAIEAFSAAVNTDELKKSAVELANQQETLGHSESEIAVDHVVNLSRSGRRKLDPMSVADSKWRKEIRESLAADPEKFRSILKSDFLDWNHAGTVIGRQKKGAQKLWEQRQSELIREHKRATNKEGLSALFHADVGQRETQRAVNQIKARFVDTDNPEKLDVPDIRIPTTVQIHPRLSFIKGKPKEFHSIVSEVYSLRGMSTEYMPWVGFFLHSVSDFTSPSETTAGEPKFLEAELEILPGPTGAPVPFLHLTHGHYTAPISKPFSATFPSSDRIMLLLKSYIDSVRDEVRKDPSELADGESWALLQPAGALRKLIYGKESTEQIQRILETEGKKGAAKHIEYLMEVLRTSTPHHTTVVAEEIPADEAFPLKEPPTIALPLWSLKAEKAEGSERVIRDAAISAVSISVELPWSSAVGHVVARYLSTEVLWTEVRRGNSVYRTKAEWDPEWKKLHLSAGQMRTPENFKPVLQKLHNQLSNLRNDKAVFERSRTGVCQVLAAPRSLQDWASEVNSWRIREDPELQLSEQLAALRALVPQDFTRVADQFERAIKEAIPVIVGPELTLKAEE